MFTVHQATLHDFTRLQTFYASYYPAGHPLFNEAFWRWMYLHEPYGICLIAQNEDGEIVGHLGCVQGGGRTWLVNILINKKYSGFGMIEMLFNAARKRGPLTVAVANEAGAGLLRKKGWTEAEPLQRLIWIHPSLRHQQIDNHFFKPYIMDVDLPKPTGHFWKQPHLHGIQLADGSTAVLASKTSGLRLIDVVNMQTVIDWAITNKIRWMDWVGSSHDSLVQKLAKQDFTNITSFPWFLDPVDFNRSIQLNLFSEVPLSADFLFHRTYADMTRIGKIIPAQS